MSRRRWIHQSRDSRPAESLNPKSQPPKRRWMITCRRSTRRCTGGRLRRSCAGTTRRRPTALRRPRARSSSVSLHMSSSVRWAHASWSGNVHRCVPRPWVVKIQLDESRSSEPAEGQLNKHGHQRREAEEQEVARTISQTLNPSPQALNLHP